MPTYKAIASTTVGSGGASNVQFTSIPQTYTDLVVLYSARTVRADTADDIGIEFNGSTGIYSNKRLFGYSGSTSGAISDSSAGNEGGVTSSANATANTFGSDSIYIPNYTSSNNKSISTDGVSETNTGNAVQALVAGLASTSSAITSIKILPRNSSGFVQYSSFTLYGVKNS